MTHFQSASATGTDPEALAAQLSQELSFIPKESTGFLYVTAPIAGALGDLAKALTAKTGVANWYGTSGIGVCATGTTYFDIPAAVALTAKFPKSAVKPINHITDLTQIAAPSSADFVSAVGIIHADPRNRQSMEIVSKLSETLGAYLVGGLTAGDDAYPQLSGTVNDSGVSGLLIGGDIGITIGLTQGCTPVGPIHHVDRAAGNVIMSLDETPALQILLEDIGIADGADPRPWLKEIHAALPIPGRDNGDYLVRNLLGIEPRWNAVLIAEKMANGNRLMFVRRDGDSAIKDLSRMLEELKSRTPRPPSAGLYYSCAARGPNLFPSADYEMDAIQQVFGDIPIVGFFGNGEIAHDRVYAYTGVLTLFT